MGKKLGTFSFFPLFEKTDAFCIASISVYGRDYRIEIEMQFNYWILIGNKDAIDVNKAM